MAIERIHGRHLSDEEKLASVRQLHRERRYGAGPMPGELPKTREQLRAIAFGNQLLRAALKRMGTRQFAALKPEQFHVFGAERYKDLIDDDSTGMHFALQRSIALNVDRPPLAVFKTMLHEMVHATSFTDWAVVETGAVELRRSGYKIIDESLLLGLNEAITDAIVFELFLRHRDDIIRELGFTDADFALMKSGQEGLWYYREIELFAGISEKIGDVQGPGAFWEKMKRGYFTGEMMHLRDIERVFGEGSLRILGNVYTAAFKNGSDVLAKKVEAYFWSDDESERSALARELLGTVNNFLATAS